MHYLYPSTYYHRNYKNDFKWESAPQLALRITKVALPFITLYEPLVKPTVFGLGALRASHHLYELFSSCKAQKNDKLYRLMHASISVASVAATIFSHPLAIVLSTTHDLVLEAENLYGLIQKISNTNDPSTRKEAFESCFRLVSSLCFLAMSIHGGVYLTAASLSIQILAGLYQSRSDYDKGNYLEAAAGILLCAIRAEQLRNCLLTLPSQKKENEEIEELPLGLPGDPEFTGDLMQDANNHLRDVLTKQELFHVINKIHHNKKIDTDYIFTLAKFRTLNNSFSSEKIRRIFCLFNHYDKNWEAVYRSNDFWNKLHLATFKNSEIHFSNENEHINYEMRRLNLVLTTSHQKKDLTSTSVIEAWIKESLFKFIPHFNALIDSVWNHAATTMYSSEKLFQKANWQENYDCMYQTEAFDRDLMTSGWNLALALKYPKNTRLDLTKGKQISPLPFVLGKFLINNREYLKEIRIVKLHFTDDDPVINPFNILELLSKCPELRKIECKWIYYHKGNVSQDIKPYMDKIIINCPHLESIIISTPDFTWTSQGS